MRTARHRARHTRRLRATTATMMLGAVLAGGLTACGNDDPETPEPTAMGADSTCADFLDATDAARQRALRQLAVDLSAPDAVTPTGAVQVDYTCAQQPDSTLGDAVRGLTGNPTTDASDSAPSPDSVEELPTADEAALAAVRDAVPAALSYRWDTLNDDMAAARAVMTPTYWDQARRLWETVRETAARQKTTVETKVASVGVVSQDPDEATFLVFLDQRTTNASNRAPAVSHQSAVVTVRTDDSATWLIDDIATTPLPSDAIPTQGPVAVAAELVTHLHSYAPADRDADGSLDGYNTTVRELTTSEFHDQYLDTGAGQVAAFLEQGIRSRFTLTGAAVDTEPSPGDTVTVLVSGLIERTVDGEAQEPTTTRLAVTVVAVDDTWRVDNVTAVTS